MGSSWTLWGYSRDPVYELQGLLKGPNTIDDFIVLHCYILYCTILLYLLVHVVFKPLGPPLGARFDNIKEEPEAPEQEKRDYYFDQQGSSDKRM